MIESEEILDCYKVPLSGVNRALMENFFREHNGDFSEVDLAYLKKITVEKWKYVIKEKAPISGWYSTGRFSNKTNYYDLRVLVERILQDKEGLERDFSAYQKSQEEKIHECKYGVIRVAVWSDAIHQSKIEGIEEYAGIILGDWFYYKSFHNAEDWTHRCKTTSSRVYWVKEYDSYVSLVKNHPEYKNTKKVFNRLISEKTKPAKQKIKEEKQTCPSK